MGAHFKALIKAILVAPLKSLENFFFISSVPEAQWSVTLGTSQVVWHRHHGRPCVITFGSIGKPDTIPPPPIIFVISFLPPPPYEVINSYS